MLILEKSIKLSGAPIFSIAEKIIRQASNISEAEEIIRSNKTYANWAIVVSSAAENRAVSFEITPKKYVRREMENGILNHTNYFQTKHLNKEEALINGARHEDDISRYYKHAKILQKKGRRN